jgi:hypothetical protein
MSIEFRKNTIPNSRKNLKMQRNRSFSVIADTGPGISQRKLLLIFLMIMLATFILSAYIQSQKVDPGQLYCARLNQRTKSFLYWDGIGCVIKTERN